MHVWPYFQNGDGSVLPVIAVAVKGGSLFPIFLKFSSQFSIVLLEGVFLILNDYRVEQSSLLVLGYVLCWYPMVSSTSSSLQGLFELDPCGPKLGRRALYCLRASYGQLSAAHGLGHGIIPYQLSSGLRSAEPLEGSGCHWIRIEIMGVLKCGFAVLLWSLKISFIPYSLRRGSRWTSSTHSFSGTLQLRHFVAWALCS